MKHCTIGHAAQPCRSLVMQQISAGRANAQIGERTCSITVAALYTSARNSLHHICADVSACTMYCKPKTAWRAPQFACINCVLMYTQLICHVCNTPRWHHLMLAPHLTGCLSHLDWLVQEEVIDACHSFQGSPHKQRQSHQERDQKDGRQWPLEQRCHWPQHHICRAKHY